MEVSPSGKVILVIPLHPRKALRPMEVSPAGMVMLVRLLHFEHGRVWTGGVWMYLDFGRVGIKTGSTAMAMVYAGNAAKLGAAAVVHGNGS